MNTTTTSVEKHAAEATPKNEKDDVLAGGRANDNDEDGVGSGNDGLGSGHNDDDNNDDNSSSDDADGNDYDFLADFSTDDGFIPLLSDEDSESNDEESLSLEQR